MIKVLIPLSIQYTEGEEGGVPVHAARDTYLRKLALQGLVPVFCTSTMKWEDVLSLLEEAQGVLFMGGPDINAKNYNEENHPQNYFGAPGRDELEFKLLAEVLRIKKPFLGICRGCQALAVGTGGKLIQHLPDLKLGETHDVQNYSEMVNNILHDVILEEGSKAYKITNKKVLKSNSGHHQAAGELGSKDFIVSGKSPEGIIEIIEHVDPNYFCFGIQCHPEAIVENSDFDPFFAAFAEELRK